MPTAGSALLSKSAVDTKIGCRSVETVANGRLQRVNRVAAEFRPDDPAFDQGADLRLKFRAQGAVWGAEADYQLIGQFGDSLELARQAVELLFEVEVSKVTVLNYAGKLKRHGQSYGQRAAWKKAYVTLAPGSQIDFLGGE